jgi:maleate cis-trans isomerase
MRELSPKHDARKSFYGKAWVEETDNLIKLVSYTTHVATIYKDPNNLIGGDKVTVFGTYSQTTLRHIKEFLSQNGFVANNSKQIMADYGVTK